MKLLVKLVVFVLIFYCANRFWYLKSDIIIGHNWDFTFPGTEFYAKRVGDLSNYTWNDFKGKSIFLQSHLVQNNFFSLLSDFFGVSWAIKILFLFVVFAALVNMQILLSWLTNINNIYSYLLSFTYAFSPYFFNIVIAGSWYGWLSYAFAPLYFYAFSRSVLENKTFPIFILIISTIFHLGFVQYFSVINLILLFYLFFCVYLKRVSWKRFIFKYSALTLFIVLLNTYWLYPFATNIFEFNKEIVSNQALVGNFQAAQNSHQSILNIFSLTGFLDRNLYFHSLSFISKAVFLFSISCVWGLIVFSLLKEYSFIQIELYFFLFIFLSFILLVKGGNPPFGEFTMWIYKNFVFMKMFRSPQNLFIAIAFLFPVLLAYAFNLVFQNTNPSNIILISALIAGLLIGWLQKGDIGHSVLKDKKRDHIDFYRLDPEIIKIHQNNDKKELVHKEYFIPNTQSPKYISNIYQNMGQGMIPELLYQNNSTVLTENINNNINLRFQNTIPSDFISSNNIRYITYRTDIKHHFWKPPPDYYIRVKNNLDVKLKKTFAGNRHFTYIISDDLFSPIFSICKSITFNQNSTHNFIDSEDDIHSCQIPSDKKYASLLSNKIIDTNHTKIIEYKKISPVKYKLLLRNLNFKDIIYLKFSQEYDKFWKLYFDKDQALIDNSCSRIITDNEYTVSQLNALDQATLNEVNFMRSKFCLPYINNKGPVSFISKNFSNSIQNNNLIGTPSFNFLFTNHHSDKFHFPILNTPHNLNGWLIDVDLIQSEYPGALTKNKNGQYDLSLTVMFDLQIKFYIGLFISLLAITFSTIWLCLKNYNSNLLPTKE